MWLHKPVIQDRHLMWKREHYSGFVLVQLRQGACVCMRVCMCVHACLYCYHDGRSDLCNTFLLTYYLQINTTC